MRVLSAVLSVLLLADPGLGRAQDVVAAESDYVPPPFLMVMNAKDNQIFPIIGNSLEVVEFCTNSAQALLGTEAEKDQVFASCLAGKTGLLIVAFKRDFRSCVFVGVPEEPVTAETVSSGSMRLRGYPVCLFDPSKAE